MVWWSFPNNLGLLGLDHQFTCILGWAYPISTITKKKKNNGCNIYTIASLDYFFVVIVT